MHPSMESKTAQQNPPMPILETHALTRCFGKQVAVDDLNIQIAPREMFGLLGPNGAGKTTTLKMLTTLLPPTSGSAQVAGYDILRQPADVRRMIGYVPQLISADATLSGYENLLIFAKLYGIPRAKRNSIVQAALEFMGLSDSADKLVRAYSGGMIRRLEIAQSMLNRPKVLFLDEPTLGLDPATRSTVWEHIKGLCSEFGTTILLTTHLMDEADELCGRLAIMNQGKISAIGSPAALKASLGGGERTLNDVFIHYTGNYIGTGGNYRDISRERRTARRLG
jgi:ABC-2 type transport system ATP-binding protein